MIAWIGTAMFAALALGAPAGTALYGMGDQLGAGDEMSSPKVGANGPRLGPRTAKSELLALVGQVNDGSRSPGLAWPAERRSGRLAPPVDLCADLPRTASFRLAATGLR